ncbi:NAD(P)H-dependent oxidoreductase (plasmid) [Leisingera sp. M527]|uniref:NAD(P)H-dependent oxidoreductase n=1 Tax=Leisingera sp. M527 TaxID=2867014 RepID=UPI0021A96AB3|nr:NAD(P)H-dependent oxidoreductase [Leisingera sp. M527]UWQ35653.1 NAD(P)H-dependent oxidoreductase [Leisingera sp. M527]
MKRILIVQGHPDSSQQHFCHALAQSYAEAAMQAGHQADVINAADSGVTFLRSRAEWDSSLPAYAGEAQQAIAAADHIVFIYPLWLGSMPALLKAWLEQVFREGFAFSTGKRGWHPRLKGKSARVIVTMGMPAVAYKWFFLAHSLRSFERNILKFCGIRPVRWSVFGMVEDTNSNRRRKYLAETARNGAAAC